MKTIAFKKDKSENSFSTRLTKEYNEYFKDKSVKGTSTLRKKTRIIFIGLLVSYCIALLSNFIVPNVILGTILSFIGFGAVGIYVALVGFNIMHDASHGSYSDDTEKNRKLAEIAASYMGGNRLFWHYKHDIVHHTYTNIVGVDHDISKSPMFRFAPSHPLKWFHKYQHIYCWPLYGLMTLYWFYFDDFVTYKNKKIGDYEFTINKEEKKLFWKGKLINISVFLLIPILLLGWQGLIGFLILNIVTSLSLSLVFQMAHVVEGVSFYAIPKEGEELDIWHIHQVQTTANFAENNKFLTKWLGGLNRQRVHHIWRNISHEHYPPLSTKVQKVCNEMNIKYISFPTFGAAIASHYRHLKALGQAA